jgi:hypothetical protein
MSGKRLHQKDAPRETVGILGAQERPPKNAPKGIDTAVNGGAPLKKGASKTMLVTSDPESSLDGFASG